MIRAMKDSNLPKFLDNDIELFSDIIRDLFPRVEVEKVENKILLQKIKEILAKERMVQIPRFIEKINQLLDTMMVRLGNMVVGLAGSGKSALYMTLAKTLTELGKNKELPPDNWNCPIITSILNPKSVTKNELYMSKDEVTQTWEDGIVAKLMRMAEDEEKEEKTLKEIDAMMEESAYEAGRKAKDAKDKSEKNYSNYFKKMDKNKLEELVKAALMGPMNETSTDKYDDNPALKGKQSELPDGLQKSIIKKSGGKVDEGILQNLKNFSYGVLATLGIQKYGADVFNKVTAAILNALPPEQSQDFSMAIQAALESIDSVVPFMEEDTNESFDSLVKKVDKSKGYTKKEAEKVAGSIAAKKRAGAGKGPTAKQKKRMAETILKELRGNVNEMAGEDLELKSLAKKMIPTLKKLGFEVEYSTDTSMKTLKNAGDKFVALRVQDGMLGAHIPFKAGLDVAKEIQKEIQKSLGNKFEYKLTKSKRGPGLEFYTILIRNK